MVCICGHSKERHVQSFSGRSYCVDCPCGNYKGAVDDAVERLAPSANVGTTGPHPCNAMTR